MYTNLGMAYVSLKKVTEAKANYLKALEIDPDNLLANYNFVIYSKDWVIIKILQLL